MYVCTCTIYIIFNFCVILTLHTYSNTVNHLFISAAPLLEGALRVVPACVRAGLGTLQLGAVAEVHGAGRPAPAQPAAVPLPALAPPGLTRL